MALHAHLVMVVSPARGGGGGGQQPARVRVDVGERDVGVVAGAVGVVVGVVDVVAVALLAAAAAAATEVAVGEDGDQVVEDGRERRRRGVGVGAHGWYRGRGAVGARGRLLGGVDATGLSLWLEKPLGLGRQRSGRLLKGSGRAVARALSAGWGSRARYAGSRAQTGGSRHGTSHYLPLKLSHLAEACEGVDRERSEAPSRRRGTRGRDEIRLDIEEEGRIPESGCDGRAGCRQWKLTVNCVSWQCGRSNPPVPTPSPSPSVPIPWWM